MPFPLLILLVGAVVGGAILIAVLEWTRVEGWIRAHQIPNGFGEVMQERLANGRYRVVAGVFTRSGTRRGKTIWEAGELDSELTSRLTTGSNVIRVYT